MLTPEQAIAEARRRIARGERCGILFGRERNGLETSEVANADVLIMIPVNSRFASLNLAQAVLLIGYEWMRGDPGRSLGRVTTYEKPLQEGLYMGHDRPASKEELIGLFEHLERELEASGFFNPAHRKAVVAQNLRTLLTRLDATDQEVRTLRGIVATLDRAKARGEKAEVRCLDLAKFWAERCQVNRHTGDMQRGSPFDRGRRILRTFATYRDLKGFSGRCG